MRPKSQFDRYQALAGLLLAGAMVLLVIVPIVQAEEVCNGPVELCDRLRTLEKLSGGGTPLADVQRMFGTSAAIAIGLKMVLSALKMWTPMFQNPTGKNWLRATTLLVGFVAGVIAHAAAGLPWWQATVVGCGGPGAVALHELLKLIPALFGRGAPPPEHRLVSQEVAPAPAAPAPIPADLKERLLDRLAARDVRHVSVLSHVIAGDLGEDGAVVLAACRELAADGWVELSGRDGDRVRLTPAVSPDDTLKLLAWRESSAPAVG